MAERKRNKTKKGGAPRVSKAPGGGLWIYGRHAVRAALANPNRRRRRLLATPEALAALAAEAPGAAATLEVVTATRDEIDARLPPGAVHQGLALETKPLAAATVDDLAALAAGRARAAVVVLDRVSDPQNLGAVLRAAAAFGALGVIVPERHAPAESGAIAKAASGALETVPLVRVANIARALDRLKAAGFWCVGLEAGAGAKLAEADPGARVALVIGAEGAGLRRLVRERCDLLAHIPIADAVDSLNLSAAAAVALYELGREFS